MVYRFVVVLCPPLQLEIIASKVWKIKTTTLLFFLSRYNYMLNFAFLIIFKYMKVIYIQTL
jgi:hypothetical protein